MTKHSYQVGDVIRFNKYARDDIIDGAWPNTSRLPLVKRNKLAKRYYVISAIEHEKLYGHQIVHIEHATFDFGISAFHLEPVSPLIALAIGAGQTT